MVAVLVATIACNQHGLKPEQAAPSDLIAGFWSYETVSDVTTRLNRERRPWKQVRSEPGDPKRPRYDWIVLEEPNAVIGDCTGRLQIFFFNDRLMQVAFYPTSTCAVEALEHQVRQRLTPSVRLSITHDIERRLYFSWLDRSLEAENDAWLRRWS